MPQRASAVKSLKKNETRRIRNKGVKSRLHTETIKFERAVERGESDEARRQLTLTTALLHKAAAKGVIHENTAARKLSKLQSKMDAM